MECLTPFGVKNKITQETVPVPCNKCPNCRKRRVSGWSFRLMQEEKQSISAHFITLTYDTKHVTITKNGFMDLSKVHLQLFFKRLRKMEDRRQCDNTNNGGVLGKGKESAGRRRSIKYYAVGEYGGKSFRPHYHIILFNASVELIQDAWKMGSVHYGKVSGASIGYTLKYISKISRVPLHVNDDRQREFSLMSKGLGEGYLTDKMIRWHHADKNERMYCNIEGGKKIAMPRYYKNKIYVESERKAIGYHQRQKAVAHQRKMEREGGENYWRNKIEADKVAFANMERDTKRKV